MMQVLPKKISGARLLLTLPCVTAWSPAPAADKIPCRLSAVDADAIAPSGRPHLHPPQQSDRAVQLLDLGGAICGISRAGHAPPQWVKL
jgi:hypothetical protein